MYREIYNIELPSYVETYTSAEEKAEVRRAIEDNMTDWEEVFPPLVGDGLLFRIHGEPVHVAVYVGGGHFLHVRRGIDGCIEDVNRPVWGRRLIGAYRWGTSR